ncbi:DMT family transporter [Amycolatopsis sp. CA-230715]|uniref:DMT family transporter n=1 Tax=Amycolatopsis sp. CA-230715 TaxID=2745196 RepID=UPI001C01569D|nr:DMT family transporter [Amycolatopsis sp. CA-230715]QWF82062.1 hypothetical protein HUW46_05499 [Amycolatopsis sp. CA-230715]
MNVIGIAFAMVGAVFAALAAQMQHRAVHATKSDDESTLGLRALGKLVRQPTWLLGLLVMTLGGTLHAIGLGLAPVAVVQPVGVIAVGASAVFSARAGGPRLGRRGWIAVGAIAAGVAGFVAFAGSNAKATDVTGEAALQASEFVVIGVIGFCLLAMALKGWARGLAFATAGAIGYGLVSVLTRAVLQQFQHGGAAAFLIAALIGIGFALLVGAVLVQQAYANASPSTVMAGVTVVDPIVAVAIGVGLLGEVGAVSGGIAVAGVLCALVAVGGVLALPRQTMSSTEAAPERTLVSTSAG